MWFRQKQKLPPGNRGDNKPTISEGLPKRDTSIEAVLKSAEEILYRGGPAGALKYLRDSPYVQSEPVVRRMQALVWTHYHTLPEGLLVQAFLDPIWCQCAVCEYTWLIPPEPLIGQDRAGLRCSSCGRVLCPSCSTTADVRCTCGGSLVNLLQPNGRKHQESPAAEMIEWGWSNPEPPDTPDAHFPGLHLYFGYEGQVPIGVDLSFPLARTVVASDHLKWAEILTDAGVYYQAQQQLDMLKGAAASSARAYWLRARLELVRLHHASERSRYRLDENDLSLKPKEDQPQPQKIKEWLKGATQQEPDLGFVWLTLAQVYLDPICGQDFAQALQCARRAQELLGDSSLVLLLLGQALRGIGRSAEALAHLAQIPKGSRERAQAIQEIRPARLEVRCQSIPLDVEAHLLLGRWYIRHYQYEKAHNLFTRLMEHCPERAEGYYGLAQLILIGYEQTATSGERFTQVRQLCLQALERNPRFGLAYELIGSVFWNLRQGMGQVTFPLEDPFSYYERALTCDPTCDVALWALAEKSIDQGQLQPALEYLEKAAHLETNNSSVYRLLAVIYRGRRQWKKEDWATKKARNLSPDTSLSAEYENKILSLEGFRY